MTSARQCPARTAFRSAENSSTARAGRVPQADSGDGVGSGTAVTHRDSRALTNSSYRSSRARTCARIGYSAIPGARGRHAAQERLALTTDVLGRRVFGKWGNSAPAPCASLPATALFLPIVRIRSADTLSQRQTSCETWLDQHGLAHGLRREPGPIVRSNVLRYVPLNKQLSQSEQHGSDWNGDCGIDLKP